MPPEAEPDTGLPPDPEEALRILMDAAAQATTREDIELLVGQAKRAGVIEDEVPVDVDGDVEVLKSLRSPGRTGCASCPAPTTAVPRPAPVPVVDPPPPLPDEPAEDGGLFAAAAPPRREGGPSREHHPERHLHPHRG